jgi:hypothetical protein
MLQMLSTNVIDRWVLIGYAVGKYINVVVKKVQQVSVIERRNFQY